MSPDELESAVDAPQADGAEAQAQAPDAPQAEPVPAPGTVCRICASPREEGQEWCLQCGTAYASPRRLGSLKSLGAATAATLLLMSGAAVASVAAINDEKPSTPTVVATVAKVAITTTPAPITPVTTPADPAVTPLPIDTPVTPTPVTPVTSTPTTTTTTTTTTPTPTSTRIAISSGSGALYDPLARALQTGDPQRAIDGDPGTSWFVTTPADGDMNVGYLLDLGEPTLVKKLQVFTKTPGMALRILAATTTDPPPGFDDSGWTEVAQEPDAGIDSKGHPRSSKLPVTIPLETNGKKYRLIVIAIETPPLSGTTARFTELRLFG
jgi:hypothetical protein